MGDTPNLRKYIGDNDFLKDLENFRKYAGRKTGFSNWDNYSSLYPGLYVLGAITSLGKTSFCLQLAEQLAKNGDTVIYFSLEQTKLEMATKCLSRNLYLEKNIKASAINIRRGYLDDGKKITTEISDLMETYGEKIKDNLNIVECEFNSTIEDICDYVEAVEKMRNKKPIVFLDYLQILNTKATNLSEKQKIDHIVTYLKQKQKKGDYVFFVISSLNRQNYLAPIDYEAFKESGGIDYTADVILGLQLQVIHDKVFNEEKKLAEKRKRIKEAKKKDPREIELVCLKNRYGIANFSIGFKYYAGYDLFKSEDDFMEVDPDADLPFDDENKTPAYKVSKK